MVVVQPRPCDKVMRLNNQDGIKYHINAMDSPLSEQDLINTAKEVIDFK